MAVIAAIVVLGAPSSAFGRADRSDLGHAGAAPKAVCGWHPTLVDTISSSTQSPGGFTGGAAGGGLLGAS